MGVEYRALLIPRDNTFRPPPEDVFRLIEALRAAGYLKAEGPPLQAGESFSSKPHVHAEATGALVQTPSGKIAAFDQIDLEDAAARKKYSDVRQGSFTSFSATLATIAALRDARITWPVIDQQSWGLIHPIQPVPDFGEGRGNYYDLEMYLGEDFIEVFFQSVFGIPDDCAKCGTALTYEDAFGRRTPQQCPKCGTAFRPQDFTAVYTSPETGEESELPGGVTFRFAIGVDCGKSWPREGSVGLDPAFVALCEDVLRTRLYEVAEYY